MWLSLSNSALNIIMGGKSAYVMAEPVTLTIKHNMMGGEKIPLHDMAEPITLTLKYMTQVSLSHSPLNTIWGGWGGGKLPHVTQLSLSHSPLNTIQCRKKFPFMTWLSLSHSPLNIKYNGEGKKTYVTRLSLSEVTGGLLGRVMDSMSGASS